MSGTLTAASRSPLPVKRISIEVIFGSSRRSNWLQATKGSGIDLFRLTHARGSIISETMSDPFVVVRRA